MHPGSPPFLQRTFNEPLAQGANATRDHGLRCERHHSLSMDHSPMERVQFRRCRASSAPALHLSMNHSLKLRVQHKRLHFGRICTRSCTRPCGRWAKPPAKSNELKPALASMVTPLRAGTQLTANVVYRDLGHNFWIARLPTTHEGIAFGICRCECNRDLSTITADLRRARRIA